MARANYMILCSAVLPKSLKTIAQSTVDLYEEDDHSLQDEEKEIRNKRGHYSEILKSLDVTEKEIEVEELIINVTIVHANLSKHRQFSL